MERTFPDQLIFDRLQNEEPMDSALNSAHFHSRRAENHLHYGRYDEAIKSHKETVKFLTKAINESTIQRNIENLSLQRKHHEQMQPIIDRQKQQFEEFLRRNGLKAVSKPNGDHQQKPPENHHKQFPSNNQVNGGVIDDKFKEICKDDNEFFSLFEVVGELKIEDYTSNDEMYPTKSDESDEEGDEEFFSLR